MKVPLFRTVAFVALLLACAFVSGCVTPGQFRYSEYTGKDVSSYLGTWPISGGTMTDTSYAVPVYRGWPEKHYQVLGSLTFPDRNADWNEDFISAVAKRAKKERGDAIIIRQGAEFGVSAIAGTANDSSLRSTKYEINALVIRWLTSAEIRQRDLYAKKLQDAFLVNQPQLTQNRSAAEMVILFLLQAGYKWNSQEFPDQFNETMSKLIGAAPKNLSGEWIYKVQQTFSSAISGGDEKVFLGLASVATDGENITIVSSRGEGELNFTGTLSKGRLSGQIGVGGTSAKCDGAATPDKISISFQSFASDGRVLQNVVLQRLLQTQKNNEKEKTNSTNSRS